MDKDGFAGVKWNQASVIFGLGREENFVVLLIDTGFEYLPKIAP